MRPLVLTALLLENAVERVVALSLVANGTADRHVLVLSGDDLAVVVDLCDSDLHRGVVLRLNQAASGSTLARDVKVDKLALVSRHHIRGRSPWWFRWASALLCIRLRLRIT